MITTPDIAHTVTCPFTISPDSDGRPCKGKGCQGYTPIELKVVRDAILENASGLPDCNWYECRFMGDQMGQVIKMTKHLSNVMEDFTKNYQIILMEEE